MTATLAMVASRRANEPVVVAGVQKAQAEWLRFRDAELEALFPETDKQTAYGSMYNACRAQQRERLAVLRTAQLRLWLDGDSQAEGCSGAISPGPSRTLQ